MRWLRHPVAALIAEILIVAMPLNLAYGYAMHTVYRLDLVWGVLFALVASIAACNGFNLYARIVARRRADELDPRGFGDLLRGCALGALLISCVVAVIALGGDLRLSPGGWPLLAGLPGVALLAGVFEELVARGVVLRNLEAVFGSEAALALSAILFGALHLGNPHATPLSVAAVGVEGGIMLGAIYLATRSLWWTIGVHLAWNFTQTTVFGMADSGHPGQGLLHSDLSGPDWLTGGAFGIEASAVSVFLCVVVAAVFLVRAYRRQRMRLPGWMRNVSEAQP
jgi:membrane protease YdiL (CAAX protease family)